MYFKKSLLMIGLAMCCTQLRAQDYLDPVVESILESLPKGDIEDFDLSEITDRLTAYQKHPLNINQATVEELRSLAFLNELQINSILLHIKNTGSFIDILELQALPHFDIELIKKIRPFITVSKRESINSLLKNPSHEIIGKYATTLSKQKGYEKNGNYSGPSGQVYTRYKFNNGINLRAGFTMEKDAGESFFHDGKGFDFYSANVFYEGDKTVKKLIVGDYLLQFGEGLALWGGYSAGKGPAVLNIAHQARGIKSHNSANESSFFRGVASTLNFNKLTVTPFVSRKKLDAGMDSLNGTQYVSSIRKSGLHRTVGERSGENKLTEWIVGANINYHFSPLFKIGTTAYYTKFNIPLKRSDKLYAKYGFSGSSNTVTSLNFSFGKSNYYLFGEIARSTNGGLAYLTGLLISPAEQLSLALAYRNYQKNYHAFYFQPFSEASTAVNEKGFYMGADFHFNKTWKLAVYADAFSHPWLRYQTNSPTKGYELFSQLSYKPDKKLLVYARYRLTSKAKNLSSSTDPIIPVENHEQQNIRLHAQYKINEFVTLRSRVEMLHYTKADAQKTGFTAYQDINLDLFSDKLSLDLRYVYFNTDDYDTRIYAYENGLLNSSTFAFYYDKGSKFYVSGRYRVNKHFQVRAKYSLLGYQHKTSIGSGGDEIAGNKRSDLKLQLIIRF